ncbi:MAG TPA: DUF559 domain-containing protein [Verrucomicrobiae bacterium]|nr:DUF559 domain-containing protein [Verrucomicrobiae bacterium]
MNDRAKILRKNVTDAEKLLWNNLRANRLNGFKFRRQHPVDVWILDFACPQLKLAIEIDGGQHAARKNEDEHRSRELGKRGWRVLRFWNHEALASIDAVMQQILTECEKTQPLSLTLSPHRGEREG